MNSLFNYELDERQIRLTLHDAEQEYSNSSWTEFDIEYPAESSNQSKLAQFNFPKINLNINRNVLVPIFFIVALGSVSAIMFKFIDFKANKPAEAERALESKEARLSVEKEARPIEKQIVPAEKKETPPPVVTSSVAMNNDSAVPANNTISVALTNSFVAQKAEPIQQQNTEAISIQKNNSLPDTVVLAQKTNSPIVDQDKPQAHTIYYKKRRKKLVVEQVETIKAPSLLSAQATPEEEPELKIKQN